ncbi:MAG: hypothetical protein IKH50_10870 [Oscillospiraceae bacterium]|nr:hypothetical protein [Oscillospiraceae bacterium]
MQSEKLKHPLENREWIEIKGRKLLWNRFISMLEWERCNIPRFVYDKFLSMIRPLQSYVEDYVYGDDKIYEGTFDYLKKRGYEIPSNLNYPEAIYDLYGQFEKELKLDLSKSLEDEAERSLQEFNELCRKREDENKRKQFVAALLEECPYGCENIWDKVQRLLWIQKSKKERGYFENKQKEKEEIHATELLCSILIHSLYSDFINQAQMQSLIEEDILSECEISKILESYGDRRDYEWYSEDFLGSELSVDTILKISDILNIAEPVFRKVLAL